MAGDTLAKRRQDAADFMTYIEQFMVALNLAATKASEIKASGVTYVDTDFEGVDATGMHHLSAAILQDGLDQLDYQNNESVLFWMLTNGVDAIFAKIRP